MFGAQILNYLSEDTIWSVPIFFVLIVFSSVDSSLRAKKKKSFTIELLWGKF